MMYFFDTYAIIEIIKGNENYKPYLDKDIIINYFILTELCYNLIKEKGENKAYEYTDEYLPFVLEIDGETIKEAMSFRYNNVKKKLSMTDCVSYIMAKKLDIKFLTGDKEFKDLPNVEFVK